MNIMFKMYSKIVPKSPLGARLIIMAYLLFLKLNLQIFVEI